MRAVLIGLGAAFSVCWAGAVYSWWKAIQHRRPHIAEASGFDASSFTPTGLAHRRRFFTFWLAGAIIMLVVWLVA